MFEESPTSLSTALNHEETVVDVDNDLQSSVQHPSELFQAASEDLMQTSEPLPATAYTPETDQSFDISPT